MPFAADAGNFGRKPEWFPVNARQNESRDEQIGRRAFYKGGRFCFWLPLGRGWGKGMMLGRS